MGRDGKSLQVDLDRSVPALLVKVGDYPVHHGGLGVVRSLGRLGVRVYAITGSRFEAAATSRYLAGRFFWRTDPENPDGLVDDLLQMGRRLSRPSVAVATDDEAAVLLAQHADVLGERFVLPQVPPTLPARLGSKRGLFESCRAHGVPTPRSVFPATFAELIVSAREIGYPVIIKSIDPWVRLRMPAVASTTLVRGESELTERFGSAPTLPPLLLQEYLPREQGEDWFVHLYADAESTCLVALTGRKLRSWPVGAGWTTYAQAVANPTLAELATRFCKQVGYQGIADLDWRYDRRDHKFNLVDFNPRVGAQFRIGETVAGVDAVRALHLDLTGRPVPSGEQVYGRRFIVENLDLMARLAHRRSRIPAVAPERMRGRIEWGWWAADDPVPLAALTAGIARRAASRMLRTG